MEHKRQAVHLSGLLFVLLAHVVGSPLISAYFFMIALTFLAYSEYVHRESQRLSGMLSSMENRFRSFLTGFERPETRPFLGAFWFYAGCGLAFLAFPIGVASAGCAMLAVGDAVSTLVGKNLGSRKLVGKKTVEGSLSFFLSSLAIGAVFISLPVAAVGALAATAAELIPESNRLKGARKAGLVDDNYIIPIAACLVMSLI